VEVLFVFSFLCETCIRRGLNRPDTAAKLRIERLASKLLAEAAGDGLPLKIGAATFPMASGKAREMMVETLS